VITGSKLFPIVFLGNPHAMFAAHATAKSVFTVVLQTLLVKHSRVSGAAKLPPSKTTGTRKPYGQNTGA
jgi:hypothetical protein